MRRILIAGAMGASLLAGGAQAQEAIVREQAATELRVDWITGTRVLSPQDEVVGTVRDLIVDRESGEMTAAIISVGGFLGIGAKQIAVDWSELQIDYDANEIRLDLTREEAEAAPDYAFREQQPPPPPPAPPGAVPADDPLAPGTGPVNPMAPVEPTEPMAPEAGEPAPQ